jgi:hypothetical protein
MSRDCRVPPNVGRFSGGPRRLLHCYSLPPPAGSAG